MKGAPGQQIAHFARRLDFRLIDIISTGSSMALIDGVPV